MTSFTRLTVRTRQFPLLTDRTSRSDLGRIAEMVPIPPELILPVTKLAVRSTPSLVADPSLTEIGQSLADPAAGAVDLITYVRSCHERKDP